jgi:hypothetical protein
MCHIRVLQTFDLCATHLFLVRVPYYRQYLLWHYPWSFKIQAGTSPPSLLQEKPELGNNSGAAGRMHQQNHTFLYNFIAFLALRHVFVK